jgi:DNA helicase-2/ATP-dependent DNA helicase PcrA
VQAIKLHPALLRALEAEVANEPGEASAEQALEDWVNLLVNRDRLREHLGSDPHDPVSAAEIDEFAALHRRRNSELADFLAGDQESQAELDPEDDALLLRAWQLRVGPLQRANGRPLRYRHVTIDEVQDLSPLEVQIVLDCLDDQQSITLAGDTQQHLARAGGFASWSEFLARVGVPGSSIDTLRVPYRSTGEILEFALGVLGELREDELDPQAARSGSAVEVFRFAESGACVAQLSEALEELALREPLASVALLAPTEDSCAEYARGFAQTDLRVRHVRDHDFTFKPGIELTTVEQSKGLEFDYVILLDVDPVHYPADAYHRRLLHVGATRAVHQLWVTCTGVPSPSLVNARLA